MIVALAFVPIQQLDGAFSALNEALPGNHRDNLMIILNWFEDYYLGREHRVRRRRPLFPPAIW
jgi:hypothetical protein